MDYSDNRRFCDASLEGILENIDFMAQELRKHMLKCDAFTKSLKELIEETDIHDENEEALPTHEVEYLLSELEDFNRSVSKKLNELLKPEQTVIAKTQVLKLEQN